MGFLSSLFRGKPTPTQYRITGTVASFIDFVINDSGIEVLAARSIVLARDFSIRLGGKADLRGGDVLAAVQPKAIKEFSELQELLSEKNERLRQVLMETAGAVIVDRICYAVAAEFEKQSPEFARLAPGSLFDA
jgi:hypothetical protein